MKISKINSLNFCAMPDFTTRKILLNAKLNGVNTDKLESLMKEIYADKYIMVNYTTSNDFHMNIYSKNDGYAEFKHKVSKYNPNIAYKNPKLFIKHLTNKFEQLKESRSKKQVFIDEIENRFGKYDESYKYAGNYSD